MGRVRARLVKRVAKEIVMKYRNILTTDFQKNKEVLADKLVCSSKRLRNIIIGYVTHLIRMEEERRKRAEALRSEMQQEALSVVE